MSFGRFSIISAVVLYQVDALFFTAFVKRGHKTWIV